MDKIQCAIIGIGGIGTWHGQMMNTTHRMTVRAICDCNEKMQAKAKENFPDAKFYCSHEEMFSKEKLDVCAVVTPHNLHAPIAIQALNAGINVIVEKPMATKYEDCLKMIETAKKSKKFVTVYHNRRLDGWYLAAKSVVESGFLGNIIELNTGINYGPTLQTWRGYKEKSGGILFDWGAHMTDYILNLAQSEIKAVTGYLHRSKNLPSEASEDYGSVKIFFESGAIGNITIYGTGRINPYRYYIVGEKATLVDEWNWEDTQKMKVCTKLSGGEFTTMEVQYQKTNYQKYYDNIAACIIDGSPLMVLPESAAKVINIFCTAEESYNKGNIPLKLK